MVTNNFINRFFTKHSIVNDKLETMIDTSSNFDYDFNGMNRTQLLAEAADTVKALFSELSGETQTSDSTVKAAAQLLSELNKEVVKFSAYPDVLELNEKCFTATGLPIPPHFKALSKQSKFYWLRFPVTLFPLENMPFIPHAAGDCA